MLADPLDADLKYNSQGGVNLKEGTSLCKIFVRFSAFRNGNILQTFKTEILKPSSASVANILLKKKMMNNFQ